MAVTSIQKLSGFISLPRIVGTIWLVIKTTQDVRDDYTILNEIEYRQILKKHFQLQLPRDIRLDNLLATNYSHDNQIQPTDDASVDLSVMSIVEI